VWQFQLQFQETTNKTKQIKISIINELNKWMRAGKERGAAYAVPEVGGTKAGAVEVVGMRVPEGATSGREVLPQARVVDLGEVGQTTCCIDDGLEVNGEERGTCQLA
jgi:hypothetical protein